MDPTGAVCGTKTFLAGTVNRILPTIPQTMPPARSGGTRIGIVETSEIVYRSPGDLGRITDLALCGIECHRAHAKIPGTPRPCNYRNELCETITSGHIS